MFTMCMYLIFNFMVIIGWSITLQGLLWCWYLHRVMYQKRFTFCRPVLWILSCTYRPWWIYLALLLVEYFIDNIFLENNNGIILGPPLIMFFPRRTCVFIVQCYSEIPYLWGLLVWSTHGDIGGNYNTVPLHLLYVVLFVIFLVAVEC